MAVTAPMTNSVIFLAAPPPSTEVITAQISVSRMQAKGKF